MRVLAGTTLKLHMVQRKKQKYPVSVKIAHHHAKIVVQQSQVRINNDNINQNNTKNCEKKSMGENIEQI